MKTEVIKDFYVVNGKLINSNDLTLFEGITKPPIYEIIRVINGVPIYIEDHLNRMYESARLTGMNLGSTEKEIKSAIKETIIKNKVVNGNIKLLSGESNGRTFFSVFCVESFYPPKEYYLDGIKTILYNYERDNPNAKVLHASFKEGIAKALKDSGAFEAILVKSDGYMPEGSRSNMFFLYKEKLYTAPKEEILLGITRKHVFSVAQKLGIPIVEESIHADDLKKIEGAFMTGTSVNILPISQIDNLKVNSVDNKIIKALMDAFDNMINEYVEKNKDLWT